MDGAGTKVFDGASALMTDAERAALAATVAPTIDALDAQRGDGRHPWQVGDRDPRDVGTDAELVALATRDMLAQAGTARRRLSIRTAAAVALVLVRAGVPLADIAAEPSRFKALYEGVRHELERQRQAPSPDFKDADARERLKTWYLGSGYTYVSLAKATCGAVSRQAASDYVQGVKPPTKLFATWLRELAGEEAYFEIVHGWGTWGPHVAERERRDAAERLAARLDAMDAGAALRALDAIATYLDGLDAQEEAAHNAQ